MSHIGEVRAAIIGHKNETTFPKTSIGDIIAHNVAPNTDQISQKPATIDGSIRAIHAMTAAMATNAVVDMTITVASF